MNYKLHNLQFNRFNFIIILILLLGACGRGDKTSESQSESQKKESSQVSTEKLSVADLREASLNGWTDIVKEAIEQEVELNEPDAYGRTALMYAAYNGHTEITRLLIDEGAELDPKNAEGRTALMFAASGPFPETVDLLISNGAIVDATDNVENWTALMLASAEGNIGVVKTLLEHGADPNLKDLDGETALDFAQNNGHNEVAKLIKNY